MKVTNQIFQKTTTQQRIPQYEPGDLAENKQHTPLPKSEPELLLAPCN